MARSSLHFSPRMMPGYTVCPARLGSGRHNLGNRAHIFCQIQKQAAGWDSVSPSASEWTLGGSQGACRAEKVGKEMLQPSAPCTRPRAAARDELLSLSMNVETEFRQRQGHLMFCSNTFTPSDHYIELAFGYRCEEELVLSQGH